MSGLHCSFCSGRHPDEVSFLVAGPGVFICDDCIDQAAALVDEKRASQEHLQQPTNTSE